MALVYDSRWRSLDASGNPVSGATLTIYTAGTTTPASIYRDAALAVPMSNPTSGTDKADSSGRFPQIYAAEGAIFDILEKDASGATLASYLSVVSLSASTGTLSRDFTNARFQARGSGGTVYVEAGDPVGDDVGGTLRLGGWNGTQADSITLDGALVNSTGPIKENSKRLIGVVQTENTAFTTVANVVIPLTNTPTGVRAWEIDIFKMDFSASADLTMVISYDGGANYKTATGDYNDTLLSLVTTTFAGASHTHNGAITLAVASQPTSASPGMLRMLVHGPDSGSGTTMVTGRFDEIQNAPSIFLFNGYGKGDYGRPTHIKIAVSTGTISGLYRVIPQRGLGET